MKVKFGSEPGFGGTSVFFYIKNKHNVTSIAAPIEISFIEKNDMEIMEPTFKLSDYDSMEFLQSMADELHRLGIKATAAPILENEITSVKYHLEDMRKLVFKK